jgi:hypothetical protein
MSEIKRAWPRGISPHQSRFTQLTDVSLTERRCRSGIVKTAVIQSPADSDDIPADSLDSELNNVVQQHKSDFKIIDP